MSQTIEIGPLSATIRECWYLASNLRCSCEVRTWTTEPTIHAVTVESVHVAESARRQGHCRRFIEFLCADQRFEMVVIEGGQNKHLMDALLRWGWDYDQEISNFYRRQIA